MIDRHLIPLLAGLGLVAGSFLPAMAIRAHDAKHSDNDVEWSEALARNVKAQVKAGLAQGAIGMEKGAEEMRRGADKMEVYAYRLERDAEFRQREALRQSARQGEKVTADQLLESVPEMRRGAEEMREGAEKMKAGAEKMRRGDDS